MRINLGPLFRPTPVPTPVASVQARATDAASKAVLIEELRSLPESGYAILLTMIPEDNNEMTIRAAHYPQNQGQVSCHGLYNYAAEYLMRRTHGAFD